MVRLRLGSIVGGLLLALSGVAAGQELPVDLETALARVGAQLERRFERAQWIVSTEIVSVRSFTHDMQLYAPPRRLQFERRVEWDTSKTDGLPMVKIRRTLQSVNGRAPRERDLEACLMPEMEDLDPLSALLPVRQGEFIFAFEGVERIDGRPVARVKFVPREAGPSAVTWDGDCVSISLDNWSRGEAWIDVESGDVLRLDQRLTRRFEFRRPAEQRSISHPRRSGQIVLERDDTSIRYHPVAFADPDETIMLPRSVEQTWVLNGAGFVPRYYRVQEFSNHRRFVTGGRVVAAEPDGR